MCVDLLIIPTMCCTCATFSSWIISWREQRIFTKSTVKSFRSAQFFQLFIAISPSGPMKSVLGMKGKRWPTSSLKKVTPKWKIMYILDLYKKAFSGHAAWVNNLKLLWASLPTGNDGQTKLVLETAHYSKRFSPLVTSGGQNYEEQLESTN